MSADQVRTMFCTGCGRPTRFEQPPCLDDHGPDCAEWTCTRCGAAVLVGPYTMQVSQLDRTPRVEVHRAA